MPGRAKPPDVTDDVGDTVERDEHRVDGDGRTDGSRGSRSRPTLSGDGAYALLWGVVALAAAALAFDGSADPLVGLAGFAGSVGLYAAARDLSGRPPTTLEYLWMGTPALLGAGIAALSGRLLVAGGLGVVALATLVEGYGWFGAGENGEAGEGGTDRETRGDGDGENRE
jgi:hypothetical protein